MAAVEVELVERGEYALGEAGESAPQPVLGGELGAAIGEFGVLGGELVAAGGERGGATGELVEVEQRGLVGVEQPAAFAFGLVELALKRGELGADELVVVGWGGGDDRLLAGEQLRGFEQRAADLGEDVGVEFVGADVAFGAAQVFAAGAQDVVVAAVVVAVEGAVAAPHLVAVAADVAVTALDQAAQQPVAGLDAARAPLGVLVADLPCALERVGVDDRRDGDRDPFLAWALAVARLGAARSAARWGAVDRLAAVVVDAADVGLVGEQAVQRRGAPDRLAGRRRDAAVVQVVRDLADRVAVVGVGGEDRAHDLGLGLVDLHPRWAAGLGRDAAVAVGNLPEEHLAGAGAVQLAAPIALGDLRALVFGDHALDLDEQLGLRVIAGRRAVEEVHRHAEALELFEDQHLVGVGAREPIRAQAQHRVQRAGFGRVAQAVQCRAVQPCSGVAVVDELGDDVVVVHARRRPQQLELRADRAALLLAFGRHARVERDPHWPTARSSRAGAQTRATRKP